MIYLEENPREAKTFTDETSPRKPPASDRKVSIHGQVIRDLPLAWFYDLMKLYPGEPGELKSNRILNDFHNLPSDIRAKIWVGMKRVVINIVDSLSYEVDYRKILADVYKHDAAYELLKLHASGGNEFARGVLDRMDEAVTEWIIRDSPPYRLRDLMRPRHWPGSLAPYLGLRAPYDEEVDLSPFKTRTSSMSGKAVRYAAKSGSVFNRAVDFVGPRRMFGHDGWTQYYVRRELGHSHAFDRGDNKSIEWIDEQRRRVCGGGSYDYVNDCGEWGQDGYWEPSGSFGRLYSVPSETSEYVQAADIAAGFARQDYERYGIAAVAGRFDYVTLNGERITQDNAEEKFGLWRDLIEQERRRHPQVFIYN